MPRHRLAFHFADESPADRVIWESWITSMPPHIRHAATLGERRPFAEVAAPFKHRDPISTRRDEEADGLALIEQLVNELVALSRRTGRSIHLLFSGESWGTVSPEGRDATIIDKLEEWGRLIAARAPDEPRWERQGWVSIWAGTLPRADFDHLLTERYGTESPISPLARSLGIHFYDHDFLESLHQEQPWLAGAAIAQLSFAESFLAQVPDELRARPVNTVIALYDADFSARQPDVARRRLRFFGAYPFVAGTR